MEWIIQPEAALVRRPKNRKKHGDFDRACSMEPAITGQGEPESAFEIEHRH